MAAALINGIAIGLPFRNGRSGGGTPSPYPKGIVGAWKTYGKTNVDADKNILKDYSGNKRDLTLMNFGYALGSGYGIWNPSFNATGSNIKISHTDYSFTVSVGVPMTESGFGFWDFGSNVELLKFNLKVSNLANTDEVYMCQYLSGQYGSVKLHNGLNSISINIKDSTKPNYPYISLYSNTPITQEFTSIVVPDYEGGLIFDGIDDYAINSGMPILTKEKGYTLFVVGKILTHATSTTPNNLKSLVSNKNIWTANDGAFIYQYENTTVTYATNFNASTIIQREQPILNYQTSKLYNKVPIATGNTENGSQYLLIGRLSNDFIRYTNLVFYAAELYDHDLTAEEIQQVSDRMLTEWYEKAYSPLAAPYQALWTANGKTNQDTDKNVPNLIDTTNPLLPANFVWGDNSGYTENGLSLDGVDDSFASRLNLPALTKYTVIGDFSIASNVNRGLGKANNWYIYQNAVYINSLDLPSNIQNAFAFNSSGLIVTPTVSYISSAIGTNISNASILSSVRVEMVFRSLAIVPYELTEQQIRDTLEYLKTTKANNIG